MLYRTFALAGMFIVLPFLKGAQCIGPSDLEQAIQAKGQTVRGRL